MTLEQKIAKMALEQVLTQRSPDEKPSLPETEYRSNTEGLPALIRSCGLSRTLAFLKARSETQKLIAHHLENQFRNTGILRGDQDLQQQLAACSLREYRAYVRLAMMIALWQKRVAQAKLRRKEK